MATARATSAVKKKGYLHKLPVSGGLIKKWNKRWVVLHATSHEGVVRLTYFDDEESELRGADTRTVNLRNCTGCCESSGYKSHPHSFQFTTAMGHHVFAADSTAEMDSWVDAINSAIKEDRARQKKASSKSKLSASAATGEAQSANSVVDRSRQGETNPSELMGTYRVTLEQNELAKKLNLTGVYNLDINPRAISLIASSTETTIAVWRYQQIKSYAKSKEQLTLTFGRSSPTGAGKLTFHSTCNREIFGVLHRNIKKLRVAMEKAREDSIRAEVERIRAKQKESKSRSDSRIHKGIRAKSMVYDVSSVPRPLGKRASCPEFESEDFGYSLIELERLPEEVNEDNSIFDPLQSGSASAGAAVESNYDRLEPKLLLARPILSHTIAVDHDYDEPVSPHQTSSLHPPTATGFQDSFTVRTIPPANAKSPAKLTSTPFPDGNPDPFANISDPFSTSTMGTFYNSQEDALEGSPSPVKTVTPSMHSRIPPSKPKPYHSRHQDSSFENTLQQIVSSDPFTGAVFNPSASVPPLTTEVRNPMAQSSYDQSFSFNLEELDSELLETLNSLQEQNTPTSAAAAKGRR